MKKKILHTITQGEINSSYISLSHNREFFSADSIGGPNKKSLAQKNLSILVVDGVQVETDIAGDKMIFRKRWWIGDFFKLFRLKAGDKIVIECYEPYKYSIYPKDK